MKLLAKCRARSAAIPKTRDPFINTLLLPCGRDDRGIERFFISSWNLRSGTACVLVSADGRNRVYRPGLPHGGFYSAAYVGGDTVWLCGTTSEFVRLTLSTGRFEVFPTGLRWSLVFAGMRYDEPTGQLLVLSHMPEEALAIAFDIKTRKITSTFSRQEPWAYYSRSGFDNGDGTHTLVTTCGSKHGMLRWNPGAKTLEPSKVKLPDAMNDDQVLRTAGHSRYGRYLSNLGWYNPAADALADKGPRPQSEISWFGTIGDVLIGGQSSETETEIKGWNLDTGEMRTICSIPDCLVQGLNITATGRLVCVNMYGVFTCHDLQTGNLENCRELDAASVGQSDRIRRIDKDRILGTTYITQRFWEVDLKKKTGIDQGRAGFGAGEVLGTWKIGGRIYMACYHTGALTEYDPSKPARFPENPRTVAWCRTSMRPVAQAQNGKVLWFSCSRKYGHLGSTLTRFDASTGMAAYAVDPLPDLQIRSMFYDARLKQLVVGTSIQADCDSFPAKCSRPKLARLDPVTLERMEARDLDTDAIEIQVLGPLDRRNYLVRLLPGKDKEPVSIASFDSDTLLLSSVPEVEALRGATAADAHVVYAGKPGLFVAGGGGMLDLWDTRRRTKRPLIRNMKDSGFWVEWPDVFVLEGRNLIALEGVLSS